MGDENNVHLANMNDISPANQATDSTSNKRKLGEIESPPDVVEDKSKHRKSVKTEERKVPNIALELAKNRTAAVPGSRPSPSIPLSSLLSGDQTSSHVPEMKQSTIPLSNPRLKVCSLLSPEPNGRGDRNSSPIIILPTQGSASGTSSSESSGLMVARTSSPVSFLPQNGNAKLNRSHSTLNPITSSASPHIAVKTSSMPVPSDVSVLNELPVKPEVDTRASSLTTAKGSPSVIVATKDEKEPVNSKKSPEAQEKQQPLPEEVADAVSAAAPETENPTDAKKNARRRRARPREPKKVDIEPANVIIEDMRKAEEVKTPVAKPGPLETNNEATPTQINNESKPSQQDNGTGVPVTKKPTKTTVTKKTTKSVDTKRTTKTAENKKGEKPSELKTDSRKEGNGLSKEPAAKKGSKAASAKLNSKTTSPAAAIKQTDSKKDPKINVSKQESAETTTRPSSKVSDSPKEKSFGATSKEAKTKEGKATSKDDVKKDTKAKRANTASKKKEVTPQPTKAATESKGPSTTPRKLLSAPLLKSPSILDPIEAPDDRDEPVIIVDVPLYPVESNDYLDENGQVVFNFYKLVQDKFGHSGKTKRNLMSDLNGGDEDDEDVAEVDDDDGIEEEEDEDVDLEEKNTNSTAPVASPKKKSHPMKGRSLIGKYDTEDPFIDDSELLWEEQRVATKDGFFVYFGPLIERGQYASFERVNGTMKRGGIKYSK
ncbi:LAME_0C07008g1_1 [Lachancea meyersii CBS 8951]|uniref:LAME_0C07008g1_1 n=1 Tax=Lachancea meyersii CBS 8951 TaxID=1266667 RepID=A0A1G4J2D5_9SACH|nr:LAME_0C07008g1_1 [Lachancea meyersii CBS 8951]